jgi:hypothetical protein
MRNTEEWKVTSKRCVDLLMRIYERYGIDCFSREIKEMGVAGSGAISADYKHKLLRYLDNCSGSEMQKCSTDKYDLI